MENRFTEVYFSKRKESGLIYKFNDIILKDNLTGILYFQSVNPQGSSMTPLLDAEGKVMVDKT